MDTAIFLDDQFLEAAAEGDIETVGAIVSSGHVDVDVCDIFGETALHRAASGGHAAVVALLLMRGAAVDRPDNDGVTALGRAVRAGAIADYSATIANLLLAGANPALTDADGKMQATAGDLAAWDDAMHGLLGQRQAAETLGMLGSLRSAVSGVKLAPWWGFAAVGAGAPL